MVWVIASIGCLNPFWYPTGRRQLTLLLHLQIRTIHTQVYAKYRKSSVLSSPQIFTLQFGDQRQKIEHAIIIAAAETNNPLIRTGTNLIDGKKAHHVSILSCKFSKPHQPDKKQKDPHTVDENSVPQYREGVRIPLWERKLKIGLMGSENLAELSQENLRQQKSVIFT